MISFALFTLVDLVWFFLWWPWGGGDRLSWESNMIESLKGVFIEHCFEICGLLEDWVPDERGCASNRFYAYSLDGFDLAPPRANDEGGPRWSCTSEDRRNVNSKKVKPGSHRDRSGSVEYWVEYNAVSGSVYKK